MTHKEYTEKLSELKRLIEMLQSEYEQQIQSENHEGLNSFVGKYFTYKNSIEREESWQEYLEVTEIISDSIRVNSNGKLFFSLIAKRFCQRPDGEIRINNNDRVSSWMLEKEITEEQFLKAQQDILLNMK